jgi:hypothetical protein
MTTIDFSHQSVVADIRWLPGIEISSRGRVSRAAEGPRECNFIATTAGDGKVRRGHPATTQTWLNLPFFPFPKLLAVRLRSFLPLLSYSMQYLKLPL